MTQSMNGQWTGQVQGMSPGLGVLEIDDFGLEVRGIAYHFPDDPKLPGSTVRFSLPSREKRQIIKGALLTPLNPNNGFLLGSADLQEQFPNTVVGQNIDLVLDFSPEGDVQFSYETPVTSGGGRLYKSLADTPSGLTPHPDVNSWNTFKEWAFSVEPQRYFYRGQSIPKRLRTSFHRTNRKNLAWYRDWDVNEMRRVLSAQLKHFFDTRDADQNGAFYNLLQHHGYPTPLLDWSLSPFVAAYFAFCASSGGREPGDVVRIYILDAKHWREDTIQKPSIAYVPPHFSILEFHAIENHRMVPQQAKATLTNIDDIESYVVAMGSMNKKEYLMAVDLPFSDRAQALSDLNLMGINAGSLFPGVDGTCEAMRYRNFEP